MSDSGYKLSLISIYNHRIIQSDQIRNAIDSTDSLFKKYANLKRYDVFKKSGVSNFPKILHDFQDRLILELDNVIKKIKGSDQSIVLDQILNDWNTRIDSLEANLPLIQQYLTQLKEAIVYSEVNETYSNELNLLQKQIINAEFEKMDIKINIFNRIDQFDTFLKNHRRNTIHEVELYTLVGKEISEDPFFQKIIKPKLYEIRPSADSGPHQVSTDNTKISSWILRELETKIVLPFFQIQYEIGKVDTELLETLSNSTMDVLIHKEHLVNMKQFTQASSARKKWILKNNPVVYDLI